MKEIDLNIIRWIQENLRNNLFDILFQIITFIGDQLFFILLVIVFYWVVNKRFAFKIVFSFLVSAIGISGLKVVFKRARPFQSGAVSIGPETHGYSFPSGHSQSTGVISMSIMNYYNKNKIVRYSMIALMFLVPFSRMYLGQHYLTDVLTGLVLGIVATIVVFKVIDLMGDKEHIYALLGIPIIVIAIIGLLIMFNKSATPLDFYDKYKDLFVAGGAYIGFVGAYAIEKLYVKHDVNTTLKNKMLKLLIGLIPTAILYFGLKGIFPDYSLIADFFRYLIVSAFAGVGAPFIFTKVFKE